MVVSVFCVAILAVCLRYGFWTPEQETNSKVLSRTGSSSYNQESAEWVDDTDTKKSFSRVEVPQVPASTARGSQFEPLPKEWEEPLFAILNDPNQDSGLRSSRLIQMATVDAKHVPRIQEECLRHLAYSLSDENPEIIFQVATHGAVPAYIRKEFVERVFEVRPEELCEWLAKRLLASGDPVMTAEGAMFLNNFNSTTASPLPGASR